MKPGSKAKPHEIAIYNAAKRATYGSMIPTEFSVPTFLKELAKAGYYVTPVEDKELR